MYHVSSGALKKAPCRRGVDTFRFSITERRDSSDLSDARLVARTIFGENNAHGAVL